MLKICAAALLATSLFAADASAAGGEAEPMPLTNLTEMPSYRPPVGPLKHARIHVRRYYDFVRGH